METANIINLIVIVMTDEQKKKKIRDLITGFKFGDDRFRGLASAEGQILPFSIDFDGRPYNSLTLPFERVICLDPNVQLPAFVALRLDRLPPVDVNHVDVSAILQELSLKLKL